jgi:hypothetical protein
MMLPTSTFLFFLIFTLSHFSSHQVGLELRLAPNGQMLFHWLASMDQRKAKELYLELLASHPLLHNVQDARGLTLLMHAAANSNPSIVSMIISEKVGGRWKV